MPLKCQLIFQVSTEVEVQAQATTTYQGPVAYEESELLDQLKEELQYFEPDVSTDMPPVHKHVIDNTCIYIAGWVVRKMLKVQG